MKRRDFIINSTFVTFGLLSSNLFSPQLIFGNSKKPFSTALEFFTLDEFLTITELCNRIIPSDYSSPGAVEASVHFFIDKFIAASEQKSKDDLRRGLVELENYTLKIFSQKFYNLTEQNQILVLTTISKNEDKPISELEEVEKFFITIKRLVYDIYYRTPIGIHMEIKYSGNGYYQNFYGCK